MAPEAPDGNKGVDGEEGIAEEGVGGQRENEVDDHAGAKEGEEVEEGLDGSQEAEGVVHRGDGQQQDEPEAHEEEAEQRGLRKGVEGGMEIELHPHLRRCMLDIAVEEGEGGEGEQEGDGIGAGDVVGMDDSEVLVTDSPYGDEGDDGSHDDEEPEQMAIGKDADEGADGIVGTSAVKELTLMEPAHGELVARHLDPYAVDAVLGDDSHGSDDEGIVATEPEAVAALDNASAPVHGTILEEEEAVDIDNHVVAHAIGADEGRGEAVRRDILFRRIENDALRRHITSRQTEQKQEE